MTPIKEDRGWNNQMVTGIEHHKYLSHLELDFWLNWHLVSARSGSPGSPGSPFESSLILG